MYKEIIVRNPKTVGSSGLRYGLGLKVRMEGPQFGGVYQHNCRVI